MKTYRLSPEAQADILAIRDRLLQARPARASSFVGEFDEMFARLSTSPFIGRSRDEIRKGLRSITHSDYIVFYRLLGHDIEVVRILHGRRDLPRVLGR